MFPLAFIDILIETLSHHFPASQVLAEPLTNVSPTEAIGVFPVSWTPDLDTKLMGQPSVEPVDGFYQITVQNLIVSADRPEGYSRFTSDAKKIRALLYRDMTLRVALAAMTEEFLDSIERFTTFDVTRQNFNTSRLNLGFYFLGQTDVRIKTHTTAL